MRIFLIGLPLAAVCLTGFTTACSGPHPGGSAAAGTVPAGPASAEGILTGHLYAVGGPAPGAPRPWPGTVTLTAPGVHHAISVGAGGGYSVLVPAGTYAVTGRSPLYQDGAGACRSAGPVTVTSGHRTRADVLCQLR